MPTYTVINKKTKKPVDTIMMTIAEMEQYLIDNPTYDILCGLPIIHSGIGMKKPEDGFRDVLKTIKRNNRKAQINTF